MATYERHLSSRRLRNPFTSTSNHGNVTKEMQTKSESRRTSGRSTRKAKTLRAHHHQVATPIGTDTSQTGKMERVDRSLKELAQLLGLQTVGVDEASLLETTVAFCRSFSSSSTTPDTHRRGGRHTDVNHALEPLTGESDQAQDVSPTDAILAGFQDCMEETIRYLVDVEGFSPEDEVVVGLTAHLLQIRAKLDINNDTTAATPWSSGRSSDGDGPTECEATTSTQTSPQETNTLSFALSADSTNLPSLPTTSRTLPGGSVTRGLPPAHLMTPLTVDTNQYYALPSPLNRTALACAMKPSEPLLAVAPTRPTHTVSAMTSAAISSVSGHPLTATAPAAYSRHAAVTSQQQVQPHQYQSVISANGCLIPCVSASTSNQRPYGFNLNYVAPYVVAWVRPVQE